MNHARGQVASTSQFFAYGLAVKHALETAHTIIGNESKEIERY
ncbi:hypothetical protein MKY30_02410 [Oceanobacillus sp. FSL W8-0428]|nr:hypothetical protein [Oceanobacillus sojae]